MVSLSVSASHFNCAVVRGNPSEELHSHVPHGAFCRKSMGSRRLNKLFMTKRSNSSSSSSSSCSSSTVIATKFSASYSSYTSQPSSSSSSSSPSPNFRRSPLSSASSSPPVARELYQPFRPPPVSSSPENLSIEDQLQILRERRGLWFDYALHIPSLIRAGFTPSMIDEATGMNGVEQNKIVVASQVRSSLQSAGMDQGLLSSYDVVGADELYELRILSAQERRAAAEFALQRKMDGKEYRELARAVKDYVRRQKEEGWSSFTPSPGDCLAFACYRLSKELKSDEERITVLKKGLQFAESEKAIQKINAFIHKEEDEDEDAKKAESRLEVIRLDMHESGSSLKSHVLPVVEATVEELEAAPAVRSLGPFSIQQSQSAWKSWFALPSWDPIKASVHPVAITYPNANFLPWKPKSQKEREEPLVLVVDKHVEGILDETYYVVGAEGGKLSLMLGTVVVETESKALGKVILALRPPAEEDGLDDIEWD